MPTARVLTVSGLIAPHAPKEGKQELSGSVAGTCYICALDTGRGVKRAPSDTFTAWAACAQGDVLCPDCARALNWRDIRMFSWLATPDGVRFVGRGDRGWLWDVLADPPTPPYALYVTRAGKKQGWISGVRQVALSDKMMPILTDWTDRPVPLRRGEWEVIAPLVASLRARKLSRKLLISGEYTPYHWREAGKGGYEDDLRRAMEYAGDPRWEIICHASNDPDDSGDDDSGAPASAGKDGAYTPLGLDFPVG